LSISKERPVSDPVQLRTARPAPDCVVLSVAGEVDLVTAPDIETAVTRELDGGATLLVVDLSGVTFFGSLGLAVLIRTGADAEERAAALRLVPNKLVLRTMELTATGELFALYPTVEAAVSGPSE
jgi:anti-sigma B factor antagonist